MRLESCFFYMVEVTSHEGLGHKKCHKTSVVRDLVILTYCFLFCKLVFRAGEGKCDLREEDLCQWCMHEADAIQINTKPDLFNWTLDAENDMGLSWAGETQLCN